MLVFLTTNSYVIMVTNKAWDRLLLSGSLRTVYCINRGAS
uniref:Uncharacterized protein n=1 Tax=Rhizophora mucronata TaxID=61149 RepID=A0A2P2KJ87_RHIMU